MSDEHVRSDATRALALTGTRGTRSAESLPLPATSLEVAQFIAMRASACVGADYSNLALYDEDRQSLRLFHGTSLDPEIAVRYTDIPVSAPFPIAAAVRLGQAVLVPNLDAYRTQFPEILADTVAAGIQATASLPLRRGDGSLVGAIGFAWRDLMPFDAKLKKCARCRRLPVHGDTGTS